MTKPALRPAVLIIAAVAVTATATALITASLVADDSVLTTDDVDRALAGATGTPTGNGTGIATGQPTTTTTTAGGAGDVVSTLTPGIVTLHCDGTQITLVSWSPNPGWRADDPVRGPAAEVSVRFESDVAEDYKVTAACFDGAPVAQLGPDDHSGGGRD